MLHDNFRTRTNVHYLVFHLTLADTITCFITLPTETVWRATIGVSEFLLETEFDTICLIQRFI